MKILLAAINAKYIHSNPAIFSLKAVAEMQTLPEGSRIEVGEYTINHNIESVRADIYRRKPDILAFSCYIWNIDPIGQLIRDLKKILPGTQIWLGGPEVSYHPEETLEEYSQVAGIMIGPGEKTFARLVRLWGKEGRLEEIPGLVYRGEDGRIHSTGPAEIMPLSQIPFWYQDLTGFENRIIYYESSRGCPFSCSYCLSSIDKSLCFRNTDMVCRELQFFLDHQVPQVKFIDRTFNCRESHALAIWSYLAEHDQGITNFHFEIAADLLTEAEMKVLEKMRPGLVQLEIGVQSTNPRTVEAIHRVMDLQKVASHVARIHDSHNIHQHLDLIAGLPYEDYASFARSFDDVYGMRPEQLQLGFLKVLKGAGMEKAAEDYDLVYSSQPPYEVLSTRWLSYEDILRLKGIEEMVEIYYNSGQFTTTLALLTEAWDSPFHLYESLAEYWKARGLASIQSSRVRKYQILLDFANEGSGTKTSIANEGSGTSWANRCREALIYDCYLRENMKNRPDFGPELSLEDWELWKDFLQQEAREHSYFPEYTGKNYRELMNCLHGEFLHRSGGERVLVVFRYDQRDPLTHNALTREIPLREIKASSSRAEDGNFSS